jgi:hypothetical protein
MMGRFLPVRMTSIILGFLMVMSSDARLGGPTNNNVPLENAKDNRRLDSSSNGDSSSSQISAYQQWINSYKYGYQQQQGSNQYQANGNDGYSQYSSYNNKNYNYNYNNAYENTDDVADDQVNNQANGYNYNDDGANANDDGANNANDDTVDDGANMYSNGDDNSGGSSSSSSSNGGMDVQSDSGGTTSDNGGWMGYIPTEWLNDEKNLQTFKMATGLLVSVIALMSIYICYLQCALRKPKDPVMKDSLLVAPESPYRLDVGHMRQEARIRESGDVMENPNLKQPTLS